MRLNDHLSFSRIAFPNFKDAICKFNDRELSPAVETPALGCFPSFSVTVKCGDSSSSSHVGLTLQKLASQAVRGKQPVWFKLISSQMEFISSSYLPQKLTNKGFGERRQFCHVFRKPSGFRRRFQTTPPVLEWLLIGALGLKDNRKFPDWN